MAESVPGFHGSRYRSPPAHRQNHRHRAGGALDARLRRIHPRKRDRQHRQQAIAREKPQVRVGRLGIVQWFRQCQRFTNAHLHHQSQRVESRIGIDILAGMRHGRSGGFRLRFSAQSVPRFRALQPDSNGDLASRETGPRQVIQNERLKMRLIPGFSNDTETGALKGSMSVKVSTEGVAAAGGVEKPSDLGSNAGGIQWAVFEWPRARIRRQRPGDTVPTV